MACGCGHEGTVEGVVSVVFSVSKSPPLDEMGGGARQSRRRAGRRDEGAPRGERSGAGAGSGGAGARAGPHLVSGGGGGTVVGGAGLVTCGRGGEGRRGWPRTWCGSG